ncbi:MAG: PBP1A family penicillin-binding protein [Gammaproteobacteria bacterium]|nr:PBP1A family penicillin-binding protein [Gammaproteobacteria bacterium]
MFKNIPELLWKCLAWLGVGILALTLWVLFVYFYLKPKLPPVEGLYEYRPRESMVVWSEDGKILGEFGIEKRRFVPLEQIPKSVVQAVLAIEDSRFYHHKGVDYIGLLRATWSNLYQVKGQGASTITMQLVRNVYLSTEKTLTRKMVELLMALKLEEELSKEKILEIYLNQIYLGQRAYGFASAAQVYFNKPLEKVSIAESAMLAGLPKAPSAYNPVVNPGRAKIRQEYIISRMEDLGYISAQQAIQAKQQAISHSQRPSHLKQNMADYVNELARQMVYSIYGEDIYTHGLKVYTSINYSWQEAAFQSLRTGLFDYEARRPYSGPEHYVDLPKNTEDLPRVLTKVGRQFPDKAEMITAVVSEVTRTKIKAYRPNQELIELVGDGLKQAKTVLAKPDSEGNNVLRPGAVIRVLHHANGNWYLTQLPKVNGAFIALDPQTGGIKSLVGGFDFQKSKFNHAIQAWRQPGSSIKPFIYSAAIEKGYYGGSLISDTPLRLDSKQTGGEPWSPQNYDRQFLGDIPLSVALAKSRNIPTVRLLQQVGLSEARNWLTKFGFELEKHPQNYTLALGTGSVTPLEMAVAYSVVANGGYLLTPYLITKIEDVDGNILFERIAEDLSPANRVISAENAFIMSELLHEVTRSGTAASAPALLARADLYGKTGTTNDSKDAWFAGFHPSLTGVSWVGFEIPQSLGERETGGGLSLPIWINFMKTALRGVPNAYYSPPQGMVQVGGHWAQSDRVSQ